MSNASSPQEHHFTVGLAMKPAKLSKHINQKLIDLADQNGIHIRAIDIDRPLAEQGMEEGTHFDVILQKVRTTAFEDQLHLYALSHPTTSIIDPPHLTHVLRNRYDMLDIVSGKGFTLSSPPGVHPSLSVQCSAPPHTILEEGISLKDAQQKIKSCGILQYPIIAKCLWADGRQGSHAMGVIHDVDGLAALLDTTSLVKALHPPVLVEQYVHHGACLFKVYVIGDQFIMVTRPSLVLSSHQRHDGPIKGLRILPDRISSYPQSCSWGKDDLAPQGHGVPVPPEWIWKGIAGYLREKLRLSLFNFDLIVPLNQQTTAKDMQGVMDVSEGGSSPRGTFNGGVLHLIDINYYPGIEKLPRSEEIMIEFLKSLKRAS